MNFSNISAKISFLQAFPSLKVDFQKGGPGAQATCTPFGKLGVNLLELSLKWVIPFVYPLKATGIFQSS